MSLVEPLALVVVVGDIGLVVGWITLVSVEGRSVDDLQNTDLGSVSSQDHHVYQNHHVASENEAHECRSQGHLKKKN